MWQIHRHTCTLIDDYIVELNAILTDDFVPVHGYKAKYVDVTNEISILKHRLLDNVVNYTRLPL